MRLALAAVILGAWGATRHQAFPRGAALRAAAMYGFFEFGVGLSLLYWAEKRVASGLSAVIYATIPLSSTLLARGFGLERLTIFKVMGASIAAIGVAVIFAGQTGGAFAIGPFVVVIAASVSAALGTVLLKRGPRQSPVFANGVGALVGLLVCLAASFALGEPHRVPRGLAQIGPIFYLTILGSVGAFVLLAWLVNHWDVSRISFVSVIVPVVALALGVVMRHERLGITSLAGSALVIAGVLVRIQADRPRARAPATRARSA
jgi:drug/metabolite transporter (DMT)-like permease